MPRFIPDPGFESPSNDLKIINAASITAPEVSWQHFGLDFGTVFFSESTC